MAKKKEAKALYVERRSDKSTENLVDCFWSFDATHSSSIVNQKIVPDNKVDLIFFEDTNEVKFCGAMTKFFYSTTQKAKGIRFNMQGMSDLLEAPLSEYRDQVVDVREVSAISKIVERNYNSKDGFDKFVNKFNKLLVVRQKNLEIDPVIDYLITSMESGNVYKLAREKIGYSEQYIRKLFQKHVGISPKKFEKIQRLQRVLNSYVGQEFSDLAIVGKYYDQSHLINDFNELVGESPRSFFN